MFLISLVILASKSIVFSNGQYILDLRYHQRKYSHGLRSGDCGGLPCLLNKFYIKLILQVLLNWISRMWSSPILMKVIFFWVLNSVVLRSGVSFEHFKVIGLIFHFFKEVGTIDFSARNGAPNQNFGIMQRLLNQIFKSLRQP